MKDSGSEGERSLEREFPVMKLEEFSQLVMEKMWPLTNDL